jgi:uncharacterized membrane protein
VSDFILRFVTAGIIFALIDSAWLVLIANKFYKDQIGHLLAATPNLVAAVLFYVIFLIGLVVFVLNPALQAHDWKTALGLGALLGFVAYATYDLTNLATLKDFPVKLVVVDLVWGTVVTASVSTLAYFILTSWFSQ